MNRFIAVKLPCYLGSLAVSLLGVLASHPAIAQSTGICPAQLSDRIQAITNRSAVRYATWGISIQTLAESEEASPTILYSWNGDRHLVPASNVKLLVTAAALTDLGPDFRIRTSVYQVPSSNPALANSITLRVVGQGDPSLTEADLQALAQQIQAQGITTVDQLLVDDSYLQGDTVGADWESEDLQAGYGAPANSLILNENAIPITLFPQAIGQPLRVQWDNPGDAVGWQVQNSSRTVSTSEAEYTFVGRDLTRPILYVEGQLQVGSAPDLSAIAITNPAENFANHFRQALTDVGISVRQLSMTTTPTADLGTEIAAVESAPLSELIAETNQHSNNLYAEALLRVLGAVELPDYAETSALTAGVGAVAIALREMGVSSGGFVVDDGSGLSRQNAVTPNAFVATLQAMARSPYAEVYRDSLSLAGVQGTLQSRFRGTIAEGHLWGKTGTLRDTVALSGYLDPPNYDPIAFSILVNDPSLSLSATRQAVDDIVVTAAQLQDCE
jgi:D-alanyl-D-alanine carboxypeptidase/D-alanyl-D-alanine-endopeptidase (penicillin-binding protein 4)